MRNSFSVTLFTVVLFTVVLAGSGSAMAQSGMGECRMCPGWGTLYAALLVALAIAGVFSAIVFRRRRRRGHFATRQPGIDLG